MNDFLPFLGICIALLVIILLVVAFSQRCDRCGSLSFGFSANKGFNKALAEAYRVCKVCGHQKVSGTVAADGAVLWFAGGRGHVDSEGQYTHVAGAVDGGGGDSGGGGE